MNNEVQKDHRKQTTYQESLKKPFSSTGLSFLVYSLNYVPAANLRLMSAEIR